MELGTALSTDEERVPGASLSRGTRGGICATPSRTDPGVYIWSTLRHFDINLRCLVKMAH